jgi:hypothetical protein
MRPAPSQGTISEPGGAPKQVEEIWGPWLCDLLPASEQSGLWKLVADVRECLLTGLHPDGFNIGFNDGLAASQTSARFRSQRLTDRAQTASQI